MPPVSFGSDNHAPVHPAVLTAIAEANHGPAVAYGADPWTARMEERFRAALGPEVQVFPVFNGTAANVLSIRAVTTPWEGVICADTAHLNTDEGGAPEVNGLKLLTVPGRDGRIDPEAVALQAWGWDDEHRSQPRVVSITQSTELGTVYAPQELRALADHAHGLGLWLHVDGARIANAAASLGQSLREATADLGVDLLSFGGTKNGALGAEAVVVLNPELAAGNALRFLRKQRMQLASKLRFLSAQLDALLADDLWLRNAAHANAMARRLADGLRELPGVEITRPVQANGVFAVLPAEAAARLQASYAFYVWDLARGEMRLMCSWATKPDEVDGFLDAARELVG